MTKIRNPKRCNRSRGCQKVVSVIKYWNLGFIWNLVLGNCNFQVTDFSDLGRGFNGAKW